MTAERRPLLRFARVIKRGDYQPVMRINFHDLWMGVYWESSHGPSKEVRQQEPDWPEWLTLEMYVCPLPALVVQFEMQFSWRPR